MKAPKFITITIVSIVLTTTLNAQEYDFSSQRLNGLEVGNFYTEEQFVEAFGEPDYIQVVIHNYFVYVRNVTSSAAERIEDSIGFVSNKDGEYRIDTYFIFSDQIVFNDYIRVGDHVSKVFDMGGTTLECKYEDGSGFIVWGPFEDTGNNQVDWTLYPAFHYDENGIIEFFELYYD